MYNNLQPRPEAATNNKTDQDLYMTFLEMTPRPSSFLRIAAVTLAVALAGCGDDTMLETDSTATTTSVDETTTSTIATTTLSTGVVSTSGETTAGTTETGPVCGDGVIDDGEACDGDALGDADCASEGFVAGDLSCDASCKLDTSACVGELMCHDEALMDGACVVGDPNSCACVGCSVDGMCTLEDDCVCGECADDDFCGNPENCVDDGLCDPYNEGCECSDCVVHPHCSPVCGDGVAAGDDLCDGDDLGGQTCIAQGFAGGGVLACDDACALNTDACLADEVCGDGFIGETEGCEGDDLAGQTCMSLGFADGDLACSDTCELDTSACTDVCGDGMSTGLEECDGDDLGGQTCVSQGFAGGGALSCSVDACTFVTEGCVADEVCGDGFIGETELCDGEDFAGENCITQGFPGGGSLLCADSCSAIDTEGCVLDEVCGDSLVGESEECDGDNFLGDTCVSLGFAGGGALACDDACAFVTEGCLDGAVCGDGFIGAGEECDGDNLDDQSCMSLGLGGGKLNCGDTCEFDTSKCMG